MTMFELTIRGLVQGVGYRPHVARLCRRLRLTGDVRNAGGIVKIRLLCDRKTAEDLAERLYRDYPAGARIDIIELNEIPERFLSGFSIAESDDNGVLPVLPSDIALCEDCRRELFDPKSRFFRYPFISCAACGPRYTIMKSTPYDRINTTMDGFAMCEDCRREYEDKIQSRINRRFYAQTIGCAKCGPQLFYEAAGTTVTESSLETAISSLHSGAVLAIKDTGGYHLVCDAFNEEAVGKLRQLKKREAKPFAVMANCTETAGKFAEINATEKELLESPARPIVLLEKNRDDSNLQSPAPSVCMNSPYIGIMLPSNGLQYLLAEEFPLLVMTSANFSGEPMITDDGEIKKLGVDVLSNNRVILTPADDSILRVLCGRTQILRRSRGFVPEPVEIKENTSLKTKDNTSPEIKEKVFFAAGADMKSAFAFAKNGRVYLSQYLGDLINLRVQQEYIKTRQRMLEMHRVHPDKEKGSNEKLIIASDLHPGYISSALAKRFCMEMNEKAFSADLLKYQHHIAHAASVVAEHGISEPALCFVFDGTGYGLDKTVWGGEVLYFDGMKFSKKTGLSPVTLAGGDEGVRNTGLILSGFVAEARKRGLLLDVPDSDIYHYNEYFEPGAEKLVYKAIELQINTVTSSSCGRLFDAVAALSGICDYSHYEGQAACELEYAAQSYRREKLKEINMETIMFRTGSSQSIGTAQDIRTSQAGCLLDTPNLIAELVLKKLNGVSSGHLAYEFHLALAAAVCREAKVYREIYDNNRIILSGGCFANALLSELVIKRLEAEGFVVYTNEKVPPGDDGIAVGQIWLAAQDAFKAEER